MLPQFFSMSFWWASWDRIGGRGVGFGAAAIGEKMELIVSITVLV